MKKAHFQYVGYPRAGSTFLYHCFRLHPKLKDCTNILPKECWAEDTQSFLDKFSKFDYSINLHPFVLPAKNSNYNSIAKLHTTKFFACLRNPYDVITSGYVMLDGRVNKDPERVIKLIDYTDHLKFFCNNDTKNFKLFYFDDLLTDDFAYLNSVCDFLEIDSMNIDTSLILKNESKKVMNIYDDDFSINNVAKEKRASHKIVPRDHDRKIPVINFSNEMVESINKKITELEQYLDRDFSHWKR